MKYKNNLSFNAKFNGKEKFGFRKLSVGLAAVALGTTFFLSDGQLAHADTQNDASATSKVVKNDLKNNSQQSNKADTQTNHSTQFTDTTQSETTPASSQNSNNKNKQESGRTVSHIQTSSLKIVNKQKTIFKSLSDSKVESKVTYSSTVTATKRNNGSATDVTGTSQKLAADQDTVEVGVHINIKGNTQITKDHPITVQVINTNTNLTDPLKINDKINDSSNWHFEKNTKLINAFNAWYESTDEKYPTSVDININVQGDNEKVKAALKNAATGTTEKVPVGVKIIYPNKQQSETKNAFTAEFVPS